MRIGYAWLAECAGVKAPTPKYYAEMCPVTRVEQIGSCLAVPASVAPTASCPLAHVLFALKYEGCNLTILAQALPLIDESQLRQAYADSPTSQYLRKACYLWERFTQCQIQREAIEPNFNSAIDCCDKVKSRLAKRFEKTCSQFGSRNRCCRCLRRTV